MIVILVLGAGGLLGSHLCALYPEDTIGYAHAELDITDPLAVDAVLDQVQPDVVINAAGIVKNNAASIDELYRVNGLAPHWIAKACSIRNIRMIHISTDCVFNGLRGRYAEYEQPNAEDAYGRSKAMGEVEYKNALVVRTSFIGWPDPAKRGLMAWVMQQARGANVPGYVNAYWNGLTVTELAARLVELAYAPIDGVIHLCGERINKYNLLRMINLVYELDLFIFPVSDPRADRTLLNRRFVGIESADIYHKLSHSRTDIIEALHLMKQKESVVWQHLLQSSSP